MVRQRLASLRTSRASHAGLAIVVASLIALAAGSTTAIALAHDGAVEQARGYATHRADGGSIERANGRNSSAVAINTTDHALVFKLTFAILKVTGDVVDNLNVADAYASCNVCQTVAISIQTLLVDSAASTVAPINEASARNQNCQQCDTVALAYQFVVDAGTKLRFTGQGRREIAYVRRQLEMLRRQASGSGMTGAQIAAAVAALMKQYAGILNTELVPVGQPRPRGNGAGTAGATAPAGVTSSTAATPGVSTITSTTPSSANSGSATTAGTISSPATTTTPTTASGATTTTSGATTTTSETPTTTTGTTGTSSGPTVPTTTTSGTTTTPSGETTTTSSSTTP